MEARALKKYIRSSPRKMRLVIDLIRGKNAFEALNILHFNTKLAAKDAEMVLRSAIANLSNNSEGNSFSPEEVRVKAAWVNPGPAMKRILPAPMGRAYRMKKRSNHLTIVVETLEK
ncbi:MAG: 50S ribosomal protein L22 [Candidatus Kapabacteria bacterium]|nr:50S ribosomal protein L22 [Candidatus Kapabacteria bacterium]